MTADKAKETLRKYDIEIFYRTGDSYSSHDATLRLDLGWDNLDNAKAALRRIKEHYAWYVDKERRRYSPKAPPVPRPEWHLSQEYDFTLPFILDNGNTVQISAFWCGYFEELYSAKIVVNEDPDMGFTV